jgi:hypothetical protein
LREKEIGTMQKSKKVLPKTGADQDAAFFAKSCVLLMHWLNVATARKLATNDIERALVVKAEAEVVERTHGFLKT